MRFCRIVAAVVLAVHSLWAQPFEVQEIGRIGVGYGVAVGDVDGDSKPDILLVDQRKVVWYRAPDWKRFELVGRLTQRDHVCLAARDLDGDGKVEVAVGGQWNPGETSDTKKSGSVHVLSRPAAVEQPWSSRQLTHHEPTIHRMRWVKVDVKNHRLVVAPLHGRGNRGGQGTGARVVEYDPNAAFAHSTVDDALHLTHNFDPVQWDDDPAEEILLGGREGVFLLDRGPKGWRRRAVVDGDRGGVGEVRAGRLGSGRRFIAAVEPMHGTRAVVWLLGHEKPRRVVLADDLAQGHAVACADLLGLGRDQVVVGWRQRNAAKDFGVRLYVPDTAGTTWTMQWIDRGGMACEDLRVADLDGDGDLDIVASGRATKNLRIYWNRRSR